MSLSFRAYKNYLPFCFCLKYNDLYKNDMYDKQGKILSKEKVKMNDSNVR